MVRHLRLNEDLSDLLGQQERDGGLEETAHAELLEVVRDPQHSYEVRLLGDGIGSGECEQSLSQHIHGVHVPVSAADGEHAGLELATVQHHVGVEQGLQEPVQRAAERPDGLVAEAVVESDHQDLDRVRERQ